MSEKPAVSEVELVSFSAHDPEDPRNWPVAKKYSVVLMLCALSFCATYGSSTYAPSEGQIRAVYGTNEDLTSIGLTLYLLGFAFGPLVWAPLGEMYGRKRAYSISWPCLCLTLVPSAFVPNFAVIQVFRFFSGMTSSCAINNGSGVISDMLNNNPSALSKSLLYYSFCPLSGPIFGSLIGYFVAAHSSGSQLWPLRVHLFFALAVLPCAFLLPETHGPTLLARRAAAMRASGEHPNAYAAHELKKVTRREMIESQVLRPTSMLLTEPIAQGAAVWIGLAYGIVYFFFEVFPVVFIQQHDIPFQLCGLTFLGIPLGMLVLMAFIDPLLRLAGAMPLPGIEPKNAERGGMEARLKLVLTGCVGMPVSLFWFAWTSGRETHWIWPVLSGPLFGYSNLLIFWAFNAYCTATYTVFAASALAANTFARSLMSSFLPVASHKILQSLGTKWGVSVFGFLSFGLVPIPLIFIRYGAALRARSRYSREAREIVANLKKYVPHEETCVDDVEGRTSGETAVHKHQTDSSGDMEKGEKVVAPKVTLAASTSSQSGSPRVEEV